MHRFCLLIAASLLMNGVANANGGFPRPRPSTPSTKPSTDLPPAPIQPPSRNPTMMIGFALSLAVASGGLIGIRRWARPVTKS